MNADTTGPAPAVAVDETAEHDRMRRLRRTLLIVLAVLVVLLLVSFLFLLSIFRPPGDVATPSEAGGVEWVRSIYGWGNTQSQQLLGPAGVGIGPDGTIWVTDQSRSQLAGFNPDGSLSGIVSQGPRGSSPASFAWPTSVAIDEDGLLYVGDQEGARVIVTTPRNEIVGQYHVPRPTAVAVRGDRVVVGSASGFVIIAKSGEVIALVGTQGTGDDQFMSVRGVAIGDDGTIYVVDQYNNRVSAYDPVGVRKWIVTTGNPGNQAQLSQSMGSKATTAQAGMQLPAALTIDGADRLVVVDPFGFNLVVLDPKDGKLIARYGEPGAQDGKFIYPSGVAYDAKRDWFAVADTQNGRVQIIRIPGSGGSALDSLNRSLAGPIRACLIPLLLLILVIISGLVYRYIRRRREDAAAADELAVGGPESAEPEAV